MNKPPRSVVRAGVILELSKAIIGRVGPIPLSRLLRLLADFQEAWEKEKAEGTECDSCMVWGESAAQLSLMLSPQQGEIVEGLDYREGMLYPVDWEPWYSCEADLAFLNEVLERGLDRTLSGRE